MDTSDWVDFGAGMALGGMMSRSIGGAINQGIDAHTSMRVVVVPGTREEIQDLLDKLDLRLANGEISEQVYKQVSAKWELRLEMLQPQANK